MRHLPWLLVLGLGCGRIGIDAIAAADGGGDPDAAPPCVDDGDPCDDGNICTDTSTCSGGGCVGIGPATCTVARSQEEYSTTQGTDGWNYGFWQFSNDPNASYDVATDFQKLALFSGELWRPPNWEDTPSPNFTWAYLAWWGGHPGTYPEIRIPIRRWVSDVSGRANAIVHFAVADPAGDGTRAVLIVDGVTVFSRDVIPGDAAGFTEPVPIAVHVGSTVDLLLDPRANDGSDTSTIWMNIESR